MSETNSFIDWEYLADQIAHQKCILVIGPELADPAEGLTLDQYILEKCRQEGTAEPYYYNEDGFFSFVNSKSRARTRYFIQKYYESAEIPPIYHELAQIPFHLVISLSPDVFLKRALDAINRPFHFGFYDKNGRQKEMPVPSMAEPVIYNLLGSVEKSSSLIFTYNDLFTYVEKIYNNNDLPAELRLQLNRQFIENYIFLGVKFEKWYLKLLFRLLKIEQVDDNYASLRRGTMSLDPHVQSFYPRHFNVQFVEDKIEQFVSKLKSTCSELIPLDAQQPGPDPFDLVGNYIIQEDLTGAFAVMEEFSAGDADLVKSLRILHGSYNGLMTKIDRNSIDYRDAKVEMGRIKERLLDMAQRVGKR